MSAGGGKGRALRHSGARLEAMLDEDDPDLERRRREWADWAAHGYRKLYTPRPMLWFGGIFFTLFAVGLVVILWLAANRRMP
jgi:hypothetical protein